MRTDENCSTAKGTVHLKDNKTNVVFVDCAQDADVSVEISLTRSKGDVEIYYQSPDSIDKLLIDTSTQKNDRIAVTYNLSLKQGLGKFYMTGTNSTFTFKINLKVKADILQYFDMGSPQVKADREKAYDEYEKSLQYQ